MPLSSREVYSHGHHNSVLQSHRWRTAANSAAYLLPRLKPADRLLDVGIGPGTITLDLAGRLSEGSVVGIDSAPAAVAATRAFAAARDVRNLRLLVGDVYHLGFTDASFDIVHAHQLLQHLANPVAALREMRRVCVPGGIVAARDADYAAMTWHPPSAAISRWLALYHEVARSNGGEPDAGRLLLSWARAADFTDVDGLGQRLVLCDVRRYCVVVRDLGRAAHPLRFRSSGRRARALRAGRTGPTGGRLAALGGASRRLVRRPSWRDPVPLLTVSQCSWQFAPPSIFE